MRHLLKHEIKSNLITINILCAVTIVLYILLGVIPKIMLNMGIILDLTILFVGMALVGVSVGGGIFIVISIVKSFNNQLFGNEGYLTFTLPISLDKILISKYIVNLLWIVIEVVTHILGLVILFLLVGLFDLESLFDGLWEIMDVIIKNPLTALLLVIQMLASAILVFSVLFLTLSILNMGKIKKGKLIVGLIIYSVIMDIITLVTSIFSLNNLVIVNTGNKLKIMFLKYLDILDMIFSNGFVEDGVSIMSINKFLVQVGFAVGLYLLGKTIIKKRLELE